MLKASALYLVIVIALVMGLLCSSLIVAAYFYRSEYQKKFRYDRLQNNLHSGMNILLTSTDTAYTTQKTFSLFNGDADSVTLQKMAWGVYDIDIVKAHIQADTMFKIFSTANTIDSSKWSALYLQDEDRPVSVSGKTMIRGDVYLPKAGIEKAYIDNKAYEGDDRLVIGKKYKSDKTLSPLDSVKLNLLSKYFTVKGDTIIHKDSISQSFQQPARILDFKKRAYTLSQIKMQGNIILHSDTTVTIDGTAVLDNVLIFARAIIIKSGFSGNCQLFATDSISVGPNCRFGYPSCIGIIRMVSSKTGTQAKIIMGDNTVFAGLLFTYEKKPASFKPLISIGKKDTIRGQIYSQDALELKEGCETEGNIYTGRFLYRNTFNMYENQLVNVRIDEMALSPYYLSSGIMPTATKKKKILQWLEGN